MKTIAILDTETTGIDPTKDAVIELAVVLWSIPNASIIAAYSEIIIHPDNPAQTVNHISPELLQDGAPRPEVFRLAETIVRKADVIVAHRAEFDRSFCNGAFDPIPWCCSKLDIRWPQSKPGDSLIYVAAAHGVPITTTHRALSDCLLLARCFERVAEMGHDVFDMMCQAMVPKKLYEVADRRYDPARNELAKSLGFQWQSAEKRWTKRMTDTDAVACPFAVKESLDGPESASSLYPHPWVK